MYVRVLDEQRPIEPIGFVVLTVSVVVAILCSPDFIAHQEHGKTKRKQRDGQKILHLAGSEALNFRISAWTLDTAVPASIVISAVSVLLSIGLVVLLVVGNQVIERESVVTCDKVNALFCFPLFVSVDLVATE